MSEQTPSNPPTAPGDPDRYPSVPSLERKLRAAEARIAELEAERDEARFQAEYYADGLESLADDLPEWQHQHADGETEDQSIIERAITTVVEWRSEKAKREKAEARIAELEARAAALEDALIRICFINSSGCDEHCDSDCPYAHARTLLPEDWVERECDRQDALDDQSHENTVRSPKEPG